jgi:hypothetical protein
MLASRCVLWFFVSGLLLTGLASCSDSTTPQGRDDPLGGAVIEGSFDPDAGTFVLRTLEVATDEGPIVRIQLIGTELSTDPDSNTVSLRVALRSLHPEPIFGPIELWIGQIQPAGVEVLNPDFVRIPFGLNENKSPTGEVTFGFDYSQLVGDDGVLDPEETSSARLWQFMSPDLAPFSFGARAEFGLVPDLARIGGLCFDDNNRNGLLDAGESPLPFGVVAVRTPGAETVETFVGPEGRYSLHVEEAGLYELRYDPQIDSFAPVAFSTPNPRHVLITRDSAGQLQGFEEADFGVYTDLFQYPPPIQFTDLPADSLHFETWQLIRAFISDAHLLNLEVGFSGCQPQHPFTLWMSGGFRESFPVQVDLVPVHELAEDCDAHFTIDRLFNLMPLRQEFLRVYGPGVLLLNVTDFDGNVTPVEWPLFPPD